MQLALNMSAHNLAATFRFDPKAWQHTMHDLQPQDVIAGAALPGYPNAYVLGCYDTRITLYSQQVRALQLAHALHVGHRVSAGSHVAVVGGGAGGMTIAAAIALQGAAMVHLLEGGHELMPLQSNAHRRRLDPHIYGWPEPGADNEEAELPILDWKSGSAVEVRATILQEFGEVRLAVGDRLVARLGHLVTGVTPNTTGFQISYECDTSHGGREAGGVRVDIIVLAIGFGLESRRLVAGIRPESYWRDAGVPGGDVEGRPRPSVAISGNGDGGLIDLVAAVSRDFSHEATIRMITKHPGVGQLSKPLADIDARARAEDAAGRGFDFVAAYDADIAATVDEIGLTAETERRLLPGIQVYLQTRRPELMSVRTATLNRLAVYLVGRACGRSALERFEHVVCAELVALDPNPEPGAPACAIDCDGRRIDIDTLVVRRGTARDLARLPFANLLRDYPADHEGWVRRFPEAAIAPAMGEEARRHFADLSRRHQLPSPRHRRQAEAAGAARRIKVALHDGQARWTGDVRLLDAGVAWNRIRPASAITITAVPADLGPLAYALARLALHAPGCTLHVDVARWEAFLDAITTASRHAEDVDRPTLLPVDDSSDLLPETLALGDMGRRLGEALDRHCLAMVDDHLVSLLDRGVDLSHVADLPPAPDVAAAMRSTWVEWKATFNCDPDLLARFLRLLVCAQDGDAAADEARTLVGPGKRKLLIRATAAALAVAAGWAGTSPHSAEPGNLSRRIPGADDGQAAPDQRTGHVCAAERISGRPTAMEAAGFLWRTDFVVLPMLTLPVAVAARAEERLDALDDVEPTFAAVGPGRSLLISLDPRLKAAVACGLAEVTRTLVEAEAARRVHLDDGIERAAGHDAAGTVRAA